MDFALLRLSSAVDFDAYPHIRPICLPEPDRNGEISTFEGVAATVTGYGGSVAVAGFGGSVDVSNTLKEVDVTVQRLCGLEIVFYISLLC